MLIAAYRITLGNCHYDRYMLAAAAFGIVVLMEEGAAAETIASADVLVPGTMSALALIEAPWRLIATLRE